MKILHILDHSLPLHSGYTFRTCSILRQQRKLGWMTEHLTSPKHYLQSESMEEVDGLRFYRSPQPASWAAKIPVLREFSIIGATTRRLAELVDRERPDLLHAHSPALNGVAALRVGRKHGIPVVYEVRAFWEDAAVDHGTSREWGMRYRATRALETFVLHRAQAVTTICEGLRQEIMERGIAAEKITVIPNGVDLERFSAAGSSDRDLAERLGTSGNSVLGFIGSFYAYEGLHLLIEALPQIQRQRPTVKVLLVGGGPREEQLRALVREHGLQESVVFCGRVPHESVQRYYDLVDIFVYPRLPMRLTDLVTPLKPLEAMAQGRLVVASDVGGHRELIRDGDTGHLFRAGDSGDLARVLTGLIGASADWHRQREAGRRYVEAERTWERSVAAYEAIYAALLRSGMPANA